MPYLVSALVMPNHFSWTTVDGRLYYTADIPLRRDMTWPDGSEFNAADVAYSLEQARSGAAFYKRVDPWGAAVAHTVIDEIITTDDHTVRLRLKWAPGLGEWAYGLLQLPIVQNGRLGPGGAGPTVPRTAAPDVHGPASEVHPDRIVLFANGSAAVSNALSGYSYWTSGVGGDVHYAFWRGETPVSDSIPHQYYVGFNVRRRAMKNVALRRSIAAILADLMPADISSSTRLPDAAGTRLVLLAPRPEAANSPGDPPVKSDAAETVARALEAAGFSITMMYRDAIDEHVLYAARDQYDLAVMATAPAMWAQKGSVADLFDHARSLYTLAHALGAYEADALDPEDVLQRDRAFIQLTAEPVSDHIHMQTRAWERIWRELSVLYALETSRPEN